MEKYYPYIRQLIHKLHLERILDQDKGTKEAVEILYRCQDKKKIWEEIWCQRIMLILAAVILSIIFLLICMVADEPEQVIQDGRIIKNNADIVTFGVRAQSGEDTVEKEITVELKTVEEQDPSPEETPVPQTEVLKEKRLFSLFSFSGDITGTAIVMEISEAAKTSITRRTVGFGLSRTDQQSSVAA